MGRPSKYTDAIFDEICERLSKGEPLAIICRDEHMPSKRAVSDWCRAREDLAARFARAREDGEDAIAADCLVIADDATGDYRAGEKSMLVDQDHIQRAKLRIDTRLKLLAKWNPKKWAEGVTLRGDKDSPLQHESRGRYELTEAELLAIAATAKGDT